MISVLPNGGWLVGGHGFVHHVALDDISATEWRNQKFANLNAKLTVALDDISATEWRSS